MKSAVLTYAAALLCFQGAPEAAPKAKIRKVVLYKHGVGYFERGAKIRGNADVALSFRSDQMKDLLTSLFAVDLGGGRVEAISYDAKDPIEKQLQDILIRVPEGNALTQFVSSLKGARVQVVVGTETILGRIMGVEPVQQKLESGIVTQNRLVLLVDEINGKKDEAGSIQNVELLQTKSLKLLDAPLQEDLRRMLEITMKGKYADRKEVKIAFRGEGEREVVIGYLVETPIWKTSYRVLFGGDRPTLLGWAIVDNPTDEDWESVELTLVAGKPLSFVLDLYTPFYPKRPVIEPDPEGEREERKPLAWGRRLRELEKSVPDRAGAAAPPPSAPSVKELIESGFEPAARGSAVGELFAYSAKSPVTVPRGKAALIPILAEKVEGDRALYARGAEGRVYNAFYFKNSSELTLEGGPVTFFEGSTSLGTSLLSRDLKKGMREMLPFAVEPGVRVEQSVQSRERPMHRAALADGILTLTHYSLVESEYRVHNETGKKHLLFLDHAKSQGYTLLTPEKVEEDLPGVYRLRIQLPEGERKVTVVKVEERREVASQVRVLDAHADQIRVWVDQPALSEKARAFLKDLLAEKTALADVERNLDALRQKERRLLDDEARYRSNLSALGRSASEEQLRARYLARLSSIEDELGSLRAKIQGLEQERQEKESELRKKVREFQE